MTVSSRLIARRKAVAQHLGVSHAIVADERVDALFIELGLTDAETPAVAEVSAPLAPTPQGYPASGSSRQARIDYYRSHGYLQADTVDGLTYMHRTIDGVVNDRITVDGEGVMRPGWDPSPSPGSPVDAGDSAVYGPHPTNVIVLWRYLQAGGVREFCNSEQAAAWADTMLASCPAMSIAREF